MRRRRSTATIPTSRYKPLWSEAMGNSFAVETNAATSTFRGMELEVEAISESGLERARVSRLLMRIRHMLIRLDAERPPALHPERIPSHCPAPEYLAGRA